MNKYLLLFIFILSTFTAFAQSYYQSYPEKNLSLGLSFNPNLSWLTYEESANRDVDAKIGYSYGLVADIGFAQNYYFATGLLINTLNSHVSATQSEYESRDIRLQYAEIPLAIKLKTNSNSIGRFYGLFGFTAGVKTAGKEKLANINTYQAIDGDDVFRLGLQIGAGGEFKLGSSLSLATGLSYNNGFTRAIKDNAPKTSYVAFNIGLLF